MICNVTDESYHPVRTLFILLMCIAAIGDTKAFSKGGPETIVRAERIIDRIDYLPFTSKKDGCYARALYMGMELAIHGIPALNHYVFGSLRPTKGIRWRYHVAPMVATNGQLVVFDPSLNERPLTRRRWLALNRPRGQTQTFVTPASHYRRDRVEPLSSQGEKGYSLSSRYRRVKKFPKYRISHIADACRTAWTHIGKENIPRREKSIKRSKLNARTRYLIQKLKRLRILDREDAMTSCSQGRFEVRT